jgi:hypothetical protein
MTDSEKSSQDRNLETITRRDFLKRLVFGGPLVYLTFRAATIDENRTDDSRTQEFIEQLEESRTPVSKYSLDIIKKSIKLSKARNLENEAGSAFYIGGIAGLESNIRRNGGFEDRDITDTSSGYNPIKKIRYFIQDALFARQPDKSKRLLILTT